MAGLAVSPAEEGEEKIPEDPEPQTVLTSPRVARPAAISGLQLEPLPGLADPLLAINQFTQVEITWPALERLLPPKKKPPRHSIGRSVLRPFASFADLELTVRELQSFATDGPAKS